MLGDKVSKLLVNLGEEELKDYESLKQVLLKEYEPSPKICLENFRKAKRNSDETFSQFASHLTSMWLYYCKLRDANDFESFNQLIVADKMFEILDSETATHIGVLQGEGWYKPRDLGKQCDIFYASKGKSYNEPERAKWNDSEKRSFNGSWGKHSHLGRKNKHFKRDCPKNKEVDNKRLNENKVSTEGTELVNGTVAARVDVLGKVIPRRAIEDKLSKLVKTSISVDGKLVHALLDSGTEITVIKKDLVPGISVEGASTIYLKGIFGPAVKCPLVYVPIGLATGGEENSLAQSSQDLRVDSGNVDETEVSLGILPEKAQEHIEDSQRNITSCRNELGTLGTKDEEVTTEMDKGSMVADSFRSEQECCAKLALAWKYAKEGKGNYYEVDGYLFRRDKILGESIGQLGLSSNVKKFCESCKECQLTRSVRIKDRSSSTPVARPELPFEVGNMDLIGPIDPPSLKGHKYILCLVDQHTRWGKAVPLTSLSAKVTCEAWLKVFSRTGGACKEPLPAPDNWSNERRYKENDLARTGEEKVRTGERGEGAENLQEELDLRHFENRQIKKEKLIQDYKPEKTASSDVTMRIILKDEEPICQPPRRLAFTERQEVNKQIEEWLNEGIIRSSCSEYASPIVMVKKKDGSSRMCIDYRKLNQKLVKDKFPLPLIEDVLNTLQEAKVYSTLDLRNGFFHVDVDEDCRKCTSFIIPDGQFEFNKVPFGLSTSPGVFKRYVSSIFRDLTRKGIVISYLDDIFIPAKNEQEGLEKLKIIFEVAKKYGLEIKYKKCQFLKKKIEFLGHVVERAELYQTISYVDTSYTKISRTNYNKTSTKFSWFNWVFPLVHQR
ncbi:hypothetical protein TNCV_4756781 [Trichonephila clavipes]|nr:hypothetical protein TNCV_4756781 [Trichonephila clavipes]